MGLNPAVTVIIPEYQPREYIKYALDSLEKQNVSKEYFEVIVVVNFRTDLSLFNSSSLNLLVIHSEDMRLSGKILDALELARGNILCFLEDDDEFVENKIDRIIELYRKLNGNVFYYYNQRILIDAEGNVITSRKLQKYSMTTASVIKLIPPSEAKWMRGLPWFNSSSISISASILQNKIEELGKLDTLMLDWFLFVASMSYGAMICIDSTPLTRYRIHGDQTIKVKTNSNEENVAKFEQIEKQTIGDLQLLKEMVSGTAAYEEIETYIERFKVLHHIYYYCDRRSLLPKFASFLRKKSLHSLKDTLQVIILSATFLLSPDVAKRIVDKIRY
jgi:glycosyltransferase involved in cell wall biosynthesis